MTSSALSPASPPVSAADRAHRYVRERILSGEIAGAAMITEGEIAEATGVSRTPVREAFLRLQAEGLLALHPKRGALVQPITPGEADDVFELRELIEAHAARRIAAFEQSIEQIGQRGGDANVCGRLTNHGQIFHQCDPLFLRA